MTDPVLIILVATCLRGVTQLTGALAQRIVLRARAELARIAVAAPPGTDVVEHDRRGGSLRIRVTRAGA